MTDRLSGASESISRRSVLAGGAVGVTASMGGCVNQVQGLVSSSDDRVGLRILTVPADNDRQTIQLARQLEANLEAAGINVSLEMRSRTEFLRSVLLDHDFDIYVGTFPRQKDPDFLYEMLHSEYANETGWQNPFGFTSISVDDLLESQRNADGQARQERIDSLLAQIAREMPFVPLCVPHSYRVVQPDHFSGWQDTHPHSRLAYLDIEPNDEPLDEFVSIITGSRPTRNLNPFSAEHRGHGTFIDLLYDSLATYDGDELSPWLADSTDSWEWNGSDVTVTLRENHSFHDGEPLTASDVAFTYEFFADTSLGRANSPLPAPNYRQQISAVESVTAEDDQTVTITVNTGQEVGELAFTIPILPEPVWTTAINELNEEEIPTRQGRWSLLRDDDENLIVGSGPFQHSNSVARDRLILERFDDHFTRESETDLPETPIEELTFLNDPGSASAVQQVGGGVAHVTTSRLETQVLADTEENDAVDLIESQSQSFYHIGFNARSSPCSNPHFRRVIARLLDREWITETIFSGYADPIATPVGNEWVPDTLEWNGEAPVAPFCGADGTLDIEAVREAFERVGFRYNENGRLLVNY